MAPTHHQEYSLANFARRTYIDTGIEKVVYVAGTGPATILMTEMPGISPEVIRFAQWLANAGMTVYLPSLFGKDGETPPAEEALGIFQRTCISAEFRALADNKKTPIVEWLRALARAAHLECGGPGVGAVGMCFTGNFALSLMLDAPTLAPVVCHPSLPINDPAAIELSTSEAAAIRQRLESENLTVLAYRFEGDKWCPAQRFSAYRQALGERFICRELPDRAANPEPPPFFKHIVGCPHSVVTAHLIDEVGQPTIAARDEIIRFLQTRLLGTEVRNS